MLAVKPRLPTYKINFHKASALRDDDVRLAAHSQVDRTVCLKQSTVKIVEFNTFGVDNGWSSYLNDPDGFRPAGFFFAVIGI